MSLGSARDGLPGPQNNLPRLRRRGKIATTATTINTAVDHAPLAAVRGATHENPHCPSTPWDSLSYEGSLDGTQVQLRPRVDPLSRLLTSGSRVQRLYRSRMPGLSAGLPGLRTRLPAWCMRRSNCLDRQAQSRRAGIPRPHQGDRSI